MPTYYPIDERTAQTAHTMVHMSDYIPGSCTAGYRASVDEAAALVESQKSKVSPYYHEKLDHLLDTYSRRLAQWHNDYNRNQAAYPSQFISGASGYNMRKHNRQMSREETLWGEYEEIKSILTRIKAVGTGPVDLADPHARELITDQIRRETEALENAKAMNAYFRKHKSFLGFPGLKNEAAEKMTADFTATRERCPWIDKPFPDYELTSIRGKIKRLQARLTELERLQQAAANPDGPIAFEGGQIIRNAEQNRLQILFSSIPDAITRDSLKSSGFRWSPSNKAWQRQLTENAERDAKRILGID